MATRLNPTQDERCRSAIKTSQLINRLQAFVFGGVDPKTKQPIEIDTNRMAAIKILLAKTLPDLSSVEINGDMNHHYVARMPDAAQTSDEWQEQHSPTLQ